MNFGESASALDPELRFAEQNERSRPSKPAVASYSAAGFLGRQTSQVLITQAVPDSTVDFLVSHGCELTLHAENRIYPREDLLQTIQGKHAILSFPSDAIDEEFFDAAGDSLRIVSNYGVGVDHIDLKAAQRRGIWVANTPDVLTEATAELAWTLLLAVARRLPEADRYVRAGLWKSSTGNAFLGKQISGSTIGILGAGRIGTSFGRKAACFGADVIYCSRRANEVLEKEVRARRVALESLFEESDFLSVHVAMSPQTRHLVSEELLGRMKTGACLINTSRGGVIDEAALVDAVCENRISVGLDVFEREPFVPEALINHPRAVLSPHIGSGTVVTRANMGLLAGSSIVDALAGKRPSCCLT